MSSTDEPQQDHRRWCIFVNGPPGAGKDTASGYIYNYIMQHASWLRPRQLKMAEPLKKATHALYNLDWSWNHFDHPAHPERYTMKDVPIQEFLGLSPREAYIGVAEDAKLRHGPDLFGWIARRSMLRAQGSQVFMFSDSGFVDECIPIVKLCSPEHVLVIELSRDGCDFSKDSRGSIGDGLKALYPKVKVQRIHNPEGDKELFRLYCHGAVKAFLDIEERDG